VVAAASEKFICIIDDSKLVDVLGKFPLPVEVIPMARSYVARQLVKLGGQPVWREGIITDNGNALLDVHHLQLTDPLGLETAVNQIAGVVTVGLFAHRRADVILVAGDGRRQNPGPLVHGKKSPAALFVPDHSWTAPFGHWAAQVPATRKPRVTLPGHPLGACGLAPGRRRST